MRYSRCNFSSASSMASHVIGSLCPERLNKSFSPLLRVLPSGKLSEFNIYVKTDLSKPFKITTQSRLPCHRDLQSFLKTPWVAAQEQENTAECFPNSMRTQSQLRPTILWLEPTGLLSGLWDLFVFVAGKWRRCKTQRENWWTERMKWLNAGYSLGCFMRVKMSLR